jgi:hypothetical protein
LEDFKKPPAPGAGAGAGAALAAAAALTAMTIDNAQEPSFQDEEEMISIVESFLHEKYRATQEGCQKDALVNFSFFRPQHSR